MSARRLCSFPGCEQPHMARSYCDGHYLQHRAGRELAPLQRKERHGLRADPLYSVWLGIKQRTGNPRHCSYHNYGGRGILLADEWQTFTAFYSYVVEQLGTRPGTSREWHLDRVDNSGSYEPGNVRWATVADNRANRRSMTAVPTAELQALRAEVARLRAELGRA